MESSYESLFFTSLESIFMLPERFIYVFIYTYLSGDTDKCKKLFYENYMHITKTELCDIYYQLFLWMFTEKNSDTSIITYIHNLCPMQSLYSHDQFMKYRLFTLSMWNDNLFKKVLYSTPDWDEYIDKTMITNIQIESFIDYIGVTIILGNKWNLIWLLDWLNFHNKLNIQNNTMINYVWLCYFYSKFQMAYILQKYNFKIEDDTILCFKYNDQYEMYKRLSFMGENIYSKQFLFTTYLTFDDFKNSLENMCCFKYKSLYIGTNYNFYYINEDVFLYNAILLYNMEFPHKIILMAIHELCTDYNHTYCLHMDKIIEKCKFIQKKITFEFVFQMYSIFKRKSIRKRQCVSRVIRKLEYRKTLYKNIKNMENCLICFESLKGKYTVHVLRCYHICHAVCIDKWMEVCDQCPYCRRKISIGLVVPETE